MSRRTLIAGNWKMHKTIAEARALVRALLEDPSWQHPEIDVVVIPPFTALAAVAEELAGNPKLAYGAQTMHWGESGPFTGEISAPMLAELGCRYVLLGHSERRAQCGETDEGVNSKVKSALAHGILPIVAVGESFSEHQAGRAKERVIAQTRAALDGVSAADQARCIVAYEPIWAIGTGLAEDPASANEVMGTIRACLPGLRDVQLLYGGSMKPANAAALVAQPNIDGGLVGGASLDAGTFSQLIRNAHAKVATA